MSKFNRLLWCCCQFLGALAAPVLAQAAPELLCQFDVNGTRSQHRFLPAGDPYTAPSVLIGERLRFKSVMLADGQGVESVNLYASYLTQRQPMLLQHVKFLRLQPLPNPDLYALTGRVFLYATYLGKELAYGCALHEVAQP
jgi:hypothetical protein